MSPTLWVDTWTVQRIQELVEGAEQAVVAVAARLDPTIVEVYGALECYHSHPEAMAAAEKRRTEREEWPESAMRPRLLSWLTTRSRMEYRIPVDEHTSPRVAASLRNADITAEHVHEVSEGVAAGRIATFAYQNGAVVLHTILLSSAQRRVQVFRCSTTPTIRWTPPGLLIVLWC